MSRYLSGEVEKGRGLCLSFRVSALFLLILLVAACSQAATPVAEAPAETPPETPTAASAPTEVAGPTATPAKATEVVIAFPPDGLETGFDPTLGWGYYGSPLFQSTLLRRDENLDILPDLATEHNVSEDGLVWRVKLRQDALFTDEKRVTAGDVAYTFNKTKESAGFFDLSMMEKASAINENEVEIRLTRPTSTFINLLTNIGIVPEHAHNENYGRNPVGSGPYKLVQWDEGQQLIAEVNPLYYGEKPQISRFVLFFSNPDSAFAAAKAGEVQVIEAPPALAKQSIEGMKLKTAKSVGFFTLILPFVPDTGEKSAEGFAIGNNITADPAIRQAINYAIDREALVEGVLEGYGAPVFGPAVGFPWDEPEAAIEDGDPEWARQILAEAGWADTDGDGVVEKNGAPAEFTILYPPDDPIRQSLLLAVVDMLQPVGIKVNAASKSWDDIYQVMRSDGVIFTWGNVDQSEIYSNFHSSMRGVSWFNNAYYANATVDKYLDQAMSAPSEAEAIKYWKLAQWDGQTGITAKGDAAWIWLVSPVNTYFVSDCLEITLGKVEEPPMHAFPGDIPHWKWVCP